ncbi:Uncharacterised protein [Sphingobacterium multivorum]|uniref:ASCH domain-containing protein n=1 Tax=Sphingobacterium multivorum TaxID=28454 RepID=UPI000E02C131|nr:ASCH domain-containing protein [Sphingobacterium multivorum]QQT43380.1 hypothetical protein I6J00_16680 [Sphingobacterium multivorum]SUI98403.1 Uncharacterised protein [Sphingobacterium multivorum]
MAKTQKTPILIIKEEYFNEILAGNKKEEYRSLSEHYFKMFSTKNEQGEYAHLKDIKEIILAVGYSANRKTMRIQLKDIYIVEFWNDIPEGFQKGDECFVLELGEVLETNFNTSEHGRNSRTTKTKRKA